MRKLLSVLLSLLLVITLLPPLQAAANEDLPFDEYGVRVNSSEAYQELLAVGKEEIIRSKVNVALDHEWKINFSDIATPNKITAITIERNGKLIPVTNPKYNNSDIVTIKPVDNYLGGQNYTLRIVLKNGKKYKMDFTTAKRQENSKFNDTYTSAEEIYIDEILQGNVSDNDKIDFYKVNIPEDGQLTVTIKRDKNPISLYLYGHDGDQGDLLAYAENTTTSLSRGLNKGTYYVKVTGNGDYEITTSFTAKKVDPVLALQNAQQEVSKLPAPVDAMPKHIEAIRQAAALVATAKALGADAIEIEKLEIKIAVLQKVVLPLEMTVTALNTKTLEVRFNRAVDTSVALFTVNGKPAKSVTFNANKTIARIEVATVASSYEVNVDGLIDGEKTEVISVDPAKVESIEILGDTAVRIVGDQVSIGYRAESQYGEEMPEATIAVTAKWTDPLATSSLSGVASNGNVKITIASSEIIEGALIDLTLTANNGKKVTKTIKVSTQAAVKGITIKEIYNEAGEELNETTKLVKIDPSDKVDEFYLLIEATDQHDTIIIDEDILNVPGTISLRQSDSSIVNFVSTTDFKLIEKKEGTENVKYMGLRLTGTPKFGETEVTLTVGTSGQKDSIKVKVAKGPRTDVIELDVPASIVADEELFIPITAFSEGDKPKLIEDLAIIKSAVSGIKFTTTPKKDFSVVEKDIVTDIDTGATVKKIGLLFTKSQVTAGDFTIKAESSTGKIITEKITVKGKPVPTTWEWVSPDSIQKDLNLTIAKDKVPQLIDDSKIQFIDQHGKKIGKTEGYSIVVTDANPKGGAVSVIEENKIEPIAIGTEIVTISIKKGDTILKGSEKEIIFKVTDGSGYEAYEIRKIDPIYDALGAGKLTQPEKYAREVIVLGVLESGDKVKLFYSEDPATTEYTFELTPAVENFLEVTSDGKLNVKKDFYYDDPKLETKRTIGIEIKSSGEVLQQEVTISKATPKVDKLQLWEKDKTTQLKTMSYETKEVGNDQAFNLAKLREKADIVVTDQYGVQVVLKKDKDLEFPDGTEIDTVLKFTTSSDGLIFTNNNTEEAAVTELPLGASFNTILAAGTASSNTVVVTVTGEGYTPEAKKEQEAVKVAADQITKDKFGILTNYDNVQEIASGIVGEEYTVTIKSSHRAISNDGKVTQQANKTTGKVEFIVAKGKHISTTSIDDLEVAKAPLIDKSLLQETINKVKYVEVSSNGADIEMAKKWTTEAEKNKLVNAVATAEAVNINAGATQLEVNGARGALEAAIESYEKAQKDGTGPTGEIENLKPITSYDPGTPEKRAEFVFTVTRALVEGDTLTIGGQEFLNVTDAASIVSAITRGSNDYTARVEGDRVILVPDKITETSPPVVKVVQATEGVGGIISTVTIKFEYVPEQPATPAVFAFKVTKELHTDDILRIGIETYKGLTDAASIKAAINDPSSTSDYKAEVTGDTITLTQKVPAPGAAPKITVSK